MCEMVQQRQTYNTCGMRSIFHLEYWHPEVWFIVGSVALGGGRFVRCFFLAPGKVHSKETGGRHLVL